jgi:hypothetical protein
LKQRDHLQGLGVDGKMNLKFNNKEIGCNVMDRIDLLRI